MSRNTDAYNKIWGAIIGLGRATEGNKNRPDINTHKALMAAFRAFLHLDELTNGAGKIVEYIQDEKCKLIPRCQTCKKQCGRNDDFELAQIKNYPPHLQSAKYALLSLILTIGNRLSMITEEELLEIEWQNTLAFLYDALFLIGSEKNLDDHQEYIMRGAEFVGSIFCNNISYRELKDC